MTNTQNIQIGSRVSYEDMANPHCEGVIADIETGRCGTQYIVAWNGYRAGEISHTDLRQRGWTVA
jgi:hypothetical protein